VIPDRTFESAFHLGARPLSSSAVAVCAWRYCWFMLPEPAKLIAAAAVEGRCPQCGVLLGSARFGSGRLADGVFCSLTCFAAFHDEYFTERIAGSRPSHN
jgi:hypothetical protein